MDNTENPLPVHRVKLVPCQVGTLRLESGLGSIQVGSVTFNPLKIGAKTNELSTETDIVVLKPPIMTDGAFIRTVDGDFFIDPDNMEFVDGLYGGSKQETRFITV